MFYQASMQGTYFLSEDGLHLSNMCDKMGAINTNLGWGGSHYCSVWLFSSFILLSIRSVRYLMTI